jgi:hypothetical protein
MYLAFDADAVTHLGRGGQRCVVPVLVRELLRHTGLGDSGRLRQADAQMVVTRGENVLPVPVVRWHFIDECTLNLLELSSFEDRIGIQLASHRVKEARGIFLRKVRPTRLGIPLLWYGAVRSPMAGETVPRHVIGVDLRGTGGGFVPLDWRQPGLVAVAIDQRQHELPGLVHRRGTARLQRVGCRPTGSHRAEQQATTDNLRQRQGTTWHAPVMPHCGRRSPLDRKASPRGTNPVDVPCTVIKLGDSHGAPENRHD